MDCEAFQAELPDMIYGELQPDAREGVEAHLASCTSCADLTGELKAIRATLSQVPPPPLLGARVKLAARDRLLDRSAPPPSDPFVRGGPVHLLATVILALCVGVAGFALGVRYQDPDAANSPSLTVPSDPHDVDAVSPPEWIDPDPLPSGGGLGPVPRAPEAWQRVLFDAASGRLAEQDFEQAHEFFRRAAAVAPEGPLAAACRVGAGECSLRLGRMEEAQRILSEVEAAIRGGDLSGSARLLQRIHELKQEISDGF